MLRILHTVSNMDRAGIETMLMNYYRHMDRTKIQFDFLCSRQKPGAYDEEIKSLGGRIYRTPGLNPAKYLQYLRYMKALFQQASGFQIIEGHNGAFAVYALYAAKVNSYRPLSQCLLRPGLEAPAQAGMQAAAVGSSDWVFCLRPGGSGMYVWESCGRSGRVRMDTQRHRNGPISF